MPTAPLTRAPRAGALDRERQRREARQQRLQALRERRRGDHARPRRRRCLTTRRAAGRAYVNGRYFGDLLGVDVGAPTTVTVDELLEGVQNLEPDFGEIGRMVAEQFTEFIQASQNAANRLNETARTYHAQTRRWRDFGNDLWYETNRPFYTSVTTADYAPFGDLYYADSGTASTTYRLSIYSLNEPTGGYRYPRREPPREIRLRVRIVDADFDRHPDPDALLGETFDDLRARLEAQIREQYGMTDDVWRAWTFDVTTRHDPNPVADSPYGDWVIEARAINQPPRDDTLPAWETWSADTWRYVGSGTPLPRPSVAELRARETRRAAERARNQLIARNRQRADRLRRKIAERKAHELLVSMLDEVQRADLERAGGFRVRAQHGDLYWIATGHAGNVYRIREDDGRRLRSFCIHTYGYGLPDEDTMLAQKLLLETDEAAFLRIANEAGAAGYADLGQREAEPERELAAA